MKRHPTERELIEYQFKLATEQQAGETCEHLADCEQCREHLERLQRKFAALDLLRGRTKVSEDLISRVTEQAKQRARSRVVLFRRPAWIGAAAALLVGLLLIVRSGSDRTEKQQVAKGPIRAVEQSGIEERMEIAEAADAEKPAAIEAEQYLVAAKGPADVTACDITEDAVPEQPPFAPASAIELVTLPRRDKVQLTIYNSADLTLVRERRNLTLKKGWNWLQFMWANTLIDPTSLSLEPLAQAEEIDIQQLVFPPRLRELGRWLVRSQISGQVPFEITYMVSGLSWRAFYMGTLAEDERTMRLQGYVRVDNNSGEDYEKAQTRLIVGKVHILDEIAELAKRKYAYDRPQMRDEFDGVLGKEYAEKFAVVLNYDMSARLGGFALDSLERKEISKEGLSEYFLYTIEGAETIPNEWGKRLLSFEAEDIAVESLYKYDQQRWGDRTIKFVAFANDAEHNLGQTPIPNGDVKIYGQADSEGYLSYVGATSIKYIPVDEEVELNLGPARLVTVEPNLMDFKTDNYLLDRRNNIAGWDEIRTWKIETTNTREVPIAIEITRGFGTAYWTLQAETPHEKHDATHARFTLTVEPHSRQTFVYTVTTYHGVREESRAEQN